MLTNTWFGRCRQRAKNACTCKISHVVICGSRTKANLSFDVGFDSQMQNSQNRTSHKWGMSTMSGSNLLLSSTWETKMWSSHWLFVNQFIAGGCVLVCHCWPINHSATAAGASARHVFVEMCYNIVINEQIEGLNYNTKLISVFSTNVIWNALTHASRY